MSAFNARALASLVSVAGSALSRRLTVILNALVKMHEGKEVQEDEELKSAVDEAIRTLMASISDPEGLNSLMMLLLEWYVCPALRLYRAHDVVSGPSTIK